ncbi:hypothetical protein J8273_2627 [Carpediemonas membranifera]|uniref:Uncharacterized protein n=1 Tax=Carpediemonas membranifera TaxID=201153 RepID=A0A8J6AYU5_9EUKA|nr:hypothetical protein J8273_2627 [Carpediemonas membranifera]|eukprot:KAG9395720.1 hypothetical protein J8273_2627 [Carpediemonas membranifera]
MLLIRFVRPFVEIPSSLIGVPISQVMTAGGKRAQSKSFLYRLPLGVILLVLSTLASSFITPWIRLILGLSRGSVFSIFLYILGALGTIVAVIEYRSGTFSQLVALIRRKPGGPLLPLPMRGGRYSALLRRSLKLLEQTMGHGVPFSIIVLSSAVYFVFQLFFSEQERVNVFGFTAVDQIVLPFYIMPYTFIMYLSPLRSLFTETEIKSAKKIRRTQSKALQLSEYDLLAPGDDRPRPIPMAWLMNALHFTWDGARIFWVDLKSAFTVEFAPLEIMAYRLFLNSRAVLYFYFAVMYELNTVYFELCLVRVCLSWVGTAMVTVFAPWFLGMLKPERRRTMHPLNLALKATGTAICLFVLWLLQ